MVNAMTKVKSGQVAVACSGTASVFGFYPHHPRPLGEVGMDRPEKRFLAISKHRGNFRHADHRRDHQCDHDGKQQTAAATNEVKRREERLLGFVGIFIRWGAAGCVRVCCSCKH